MDDDDEIVVEIHDELDQRIADLFKVFDIGGHNTVDPKDIGCIIRACGCVPTDEEIEEFVTPLEDKELNNVHLVNFLPKMAKVINDHKWHPSTPEELLAAFRTIDDINVGYITREFMSKIMMEYGEKFNQDQVDEMMATACDPQSDTINYEYFVNQLMYVPSDEDDLYKLADRIEAAKPKAKVGTMSAILAAAKALENM